MMVLSSVVQQFSNFFNWLLKSIKYLMQEPNDQLMSYNSELLVVFLKFLYDQDPVKDLVELSEADDDIEIDLKTIERVKQLIQFGGFSDTDFLRRTLTKEFQHMVSSFKMALQMPFTTISRKISCMKLLPLCPLQLSTTQTCTTIPMSLSFYKNELSADTPCESGFTDYISFQVPDEAFLDIKNCIGIVKGFKQNSNNETNGYTSLEAVLLLSVPDGYHCVDLSLYKDKELVLLMNETSANPEGSGEGCMMVVQTGDLPFMSISRSSCLNQSHQHSVKINCSLRSKAPLFTWKMENEKVRKVPHSTIAPLAVSETKYQLHAKEMVRSIDVSKYDGIVCVSGDGILVEVVNGLLQRPDWKTAFKLPIGMIPAGTGNGMIKSLLDPVGLRCCANSATISIIRGHTRSLDVASISQGTTKFFSVLMLAWGLVADIDIESEEFRWMGSARINFYALQRIICLRRYSGRILFVPAPGFESYGEPASYSVDNDSVVGDKAVGYQGPDTKLEDLEWREISGPFVSVWLHNVPWGAENTLAAPGAKFSDGFLDLIVLKNCPKLALLSLMTQISDGTHVQSPYVSYLKVKAFALEPGALVEETDKEGIIDADGEVLARGRRSYKCDEKALMSYDKLEITVDQGLATLFSPEY